MAKRTLVKGGCIVSEEHCFHGDILIEGETITQLGTDLGLDADVLINAEGKHVFPGGIDAHVHMDVLCEDNSISAGYATETVGAAQGGTTTILDYVPQNEAATLHETVAVWQAKASANSAVDFGFHIIVTDVSESVLNEMVQLKQDGIISFKLFMANTIALSDAEMLKAMETIGINGGLACIHAENKAMIEFLQQRHAARGFLSPYYHAQSRPIYSETEAINRVIAFSEMTGCPTLIAHISSGQALAVVKAAKEKGLPVFGESCPHYLLLNEDRYSLPNFESAKYVISPPLRSHVNNDHLWHGIRNDDIDIISSDHNGFSFAEHKRLGINDYRKIPNGSPGIEHRFGLLLDGCLRRDIPLAQFVKLISTNPAKLFGLYPRKGAILPGSDGDLVVVDLCKTQVISATTQSQQSDYSPYEGFEQIGGIDAVLLRGNLIVEKNSFVGKRGQGVYLK